MHTCALGCMPVARHATQSNSVTDSSMWSINACMSPGNLCIMAISSVQARQRILPERATMSVLLNPFLEKAARRSLRLELGPGRSLLAKDALAVVASLLPSRTVHDGPPSCAGSPTKHVVLIVTCYMYFHSADGTTRVFTQAQEGNREL